MLAKEYRKWFVGKGLFKSLRDKMAENAALAKLLGGRAVWITLAHPAPRISQCEDILFARDKIAWDGGAEYRSATRRAAFRRRTTPALGKRRCGRRRLHVCAGEGEVREVREAWHALWTDPCGRVDQSRLRCLHPDVWPPEPKLGTIDELAGLLSPRRNCVVALHDNYMDVYDNNPSFPKGVIRQADGSLMTGGFWAGGQAAS